MELCRRIRGASQRVPLLLLKALDSLDDKKAGFAAGADDYLVKLFEFGELLMRARALTQRCAVASGERRELRMADLVLGLDAKTVTRAGQRIDLTPRETALAYDDNPPAARESLAHSLDAARHLQSLTASLLALAKADGTLPDFTPVRLDECLNQALDFARAKYPSRELRLTFGALLAEPEGDIFMLPGNAELLTTALFNLLDNAAKYSASQVAAELAYAGPATLRVRVSDAGPSLSPEELSHIYEPLYRAGGAVGRPGYGLGLPLTQRIVQRHGGRLKLASAVGQGTTATVWLPAVLV